MTYNYSICHPDKSDIEYPNKELNSNEVLEFVETYPWVSIMQSMEKMSNDEIHYSPSLDFKSIDKVRNLGISAILKNGNPEFSLWYNRPVKFRPFFGLLRERTANKTTEKWGFTLDNDLKSYQLYLDGQFSKLEKLMTEK